jgi:cobyrinic acid a,c-diamide synthase
MQVVPMDPLRDEDLPRGCAGLYLGGGFPQLYAGDLSANAGLRRRVAQAAASGMPIVAECAGLLYLCQDIDGVPMVGALNARARMTPTLTLGYRHAVAVNDSVVAQAGAAVTGHEFHRTQVEPAHGETPAWRVHRHQQPPAAHGFVSGVGGSIHATFLHLHWAGHPYIAARFATAVRRFAHRKVDSGQLSADLTGSSR